MSIGRAPYRVALFAAFSFLIAACGGDRDDGPRHNENHDPDATSVILGETTFLTVVNPEINDLNNIDVPPPAGERTDVNVEAQDIETSTGDYGSAVVAPLDYGTVELYFFGFDIDGSIEQEIGDGQLVELAVAADGSDIEVMERVDYHFDSDDVEVVEFTTDDSVGEVSDALREDNRIVLLRDGTYTVGEDGDGTLEFRGVNLTLFGAGDRGGRVIIEGNIDFRGHGNRVRGADIVGNVDMSGPDSALTFSTIDGDVSATANNAVMLENIFCGDVNAPGSNTSALGNRGIEPLDAPSDACPIFDDDEQD